MMKRALILFAHGARDPAWAAPFRRLQALLQTQRPEFTVELAFLELMTPDLPQCVAQLLPEGVDDITVVPVFLGQGGHVQRDLPQLVEDLRAAHAGLTMRVAAPVGEDADVLEAMAQYCIRSLTA
ncbi:MAG: cobalamin biosynthesis protein CbiX [Herbaspirillum sp.]|jgi:sirohydrochlorin cobaltochelatase|nr:cobalamin biosynthesis protein CbiX [Herbaspirillum sp.]